jgi:hypothetical protein
MPTRPWHVFSEAAFLAVSWTWCIGMWLPVLLIRDFGLWSFAVFALPNCFGAAAMGFALAKPGAAIDFLQRHQLAISLFSAVTSAFQSFFLVWLLIVNGMSTEGLILIGLVLASIFAQPLFRGERVRTTAVAVFIASLALAAWWLLGNFDRATAAQLPPPARNIEGLGGLAAVCMLGFVCCPFLDATFLQARIRSRGTPGTASFLLGFLVLFASMITLTFFYGIDIVSKAHAADKPVHVFYLALPLIFHIGMQLLFTISVHEGFLREGEPAARVGHRDGLSLAAFATGLIAAVAALRLPTLRADMTNWELFYRCFMSFYGLVFPAYVWIIAWPFQRRAGVVTMPRVAIMAGAVVAAAPFYWIGFIDRESNWLYGGVGIVLVAGIIARLLPGPASPLGPSGGAVLEPTDPTPRPLAAAATPDR